MNTVAILAIKQANQTSDHKETKRSTDHRSYQERQKCHLKETRRDCKYFIWDWSKSGNTYSFNDIKLGVGRENAKRFLRADKKLMAEIRKKIISEIKAREAEE